MLADPSQLSWVSTSASSWRSSPSPAQLEKKNYKADLQALKISMEEVVSAVNVIKAMEPRPGDSWRRNRRQYIIPDIYVTRWTTISSSS